MNRLNIIIALLICPYIMWAQTFISEPTDTTALVEYNDGKQWVYREIDKLIVGLTNEEVNDDYGKYYRIEINIRNNRDSSLTFNPDDVFAELISKKGDIVTMDVYTHEEYQKKLKRSQTVATALNNLSTSIDTYNTGYSTTHTSTLTNNGYVFSVSETKTYDPNAVRKATIAADKQRKEFAEKMEHDRAIREQGYLKLNTIHPGDAIAGFMNIKHKKGKKLNVTINIGENEFSYLWDIDKKKKK